MNHFENPMAYNQEMGPYESAEAIFNEAETMELALELLSVSNEAELDQFLGKLFKGAWRGIKKVGSVLGKVARPLGGILKGVAKTALPFVGGALGSFIPIPGVGTAIGTALGSAVGKALEAEFQGMEAEERDLEIARRFVQMAGNAARLAVQAPHLIDPVQAAKQAVTQAARRFVPNLGGIGLDVRTTYGQARNGRWIRRGPNVILLNC